MKAPAAAELAERWHAIARRLTAGAEEPPLVTVPAEELEHLALWAAAGAELVAKIEAAECCESTPCPHAAVWRVRWADNDLHLCDRHRARIERLAAGLELKVNAERLPSL